MLLVTPYRRTNDEWKSCAKYLLADLRDTHKAEHSPLRLIPVQKETITTSFMFCFGGIGYCRYTPITIRPAPSVT